MGSSQKGLSLKYWQAWVDALDGDFDGDKPDMTVQQAFSKEGWFRRCIDVRASSLAAMPWEIIPLGSEDPAWVSGEGSPEPWEWFHADDYLYRTAAALTLTGHSVAQKEGTLNKDMRYPSLEAVDNLKHYNPLTIKPEYEKGEYGPDEMGNFRYFCRTVSGHKYHIHRDSVVYVFQPDPFTEQGSGSSIGEAARQQAQVLFDMGDFTSDQLRSGLPKKVVFVADKDARQPNEEQLKKWQRWIQRHILGAKGTPPEVMQGLDTKEIGSSLSDLHSEAITKDAREAVASSLGIPHSLIMSNAANFATAQADQLNFYTTTIIPQAKLIQHNLNAQFMREVGFKFQFRPDKLEVFQAYELEKAQGLIALTGGKPVLTQDEARERVEADPLGYDDLDVVRQNDVKNWTKKIERVGRDCDFEPLGLNDTEAGVIRERLAAGKSLDKVFSPPYADF